MTIDDNIRDEIIQYNINTEAAKMSSLSSGKFDNYEYFSGEEVFLFDQSRITEQARFAHSRLKKALAKQQNLKTQLKNKQKQLQI